MEHDFSSLEPVFTDLKALLAEQGFYPVDEINRRFLRIGRPGFVAVQRQPVGADLKEGWAYGVIARAIIVGGKQVRYAPERIRVTATVVWHPKARTAVRYVRKRWPNRIIISRATQGVHRQNCDWEQVGPEEVVPELVRSWRLGAA